MSSGYHRPASSMLMHRTVFVVEHQSHQATVLEVVARLCSLEPTRFLTAEGALSAVERGPPDLLFTDLILPGRDGLSLIRATKARSPKTTCVLLSSVPPGLSEAAATRSGIDALIVRRGRWCTLLAQHAGPLGDAEAERILGLIERGSDGFDELAADLLAHRLSTEHEALVLRYLAAAFDPDRVLGVLERVVIRDSKSARVLHEEIHRVALELAIDLGGAGFGVVEEIAASSAATPQLRACAMRHLARSFPHHAIMPVLASNLQDPSPLVRLDAAYAVLESASRVGEQGLTTLSEIVAANDLPDELRIAAIERLARDLPRAEVKSILTRALASDRPSIVQAASLSVMKGDGVDVEALAGQATRGSIEARVAALKTLASDFPKEAVLPILEHFQRDPEPSIRLYAFELAASRADTGFEPTIARAIAEGRAALEACLFGALRLGSAGFDAIAAIASDERADVAVRASAVRMLGARFAAARSAPLLAALASGGSFEVASAALLAAVQLRAPGFAVLKAAQTSSNIPAVRELALIHLEEHAPDPVFKPALQRALRDPDLGVRCRAIELWMRRLGGEYAPLLERLARSGLRELEDAGLDGAIALGEGGFTAIAAFALQPDLDPAVRKRAFDTLVARFSEEEIAPMRNAYVEPSAPTEPAEPAEPIVESWEIAKTKPTRPAIAPDDRREPVPAGEKETPVDVEPRAPVEHADATRDARSIDAPVAPPEAHRPQIDLERARRALEAAILLGRDGYKAIRALAESRRVPDEVRIFALRRLAADFPDHDVMPVIEKAIADPSFAVQNAGLGCAMLRKDTRFEPIAALALDPAADTGLRIRAIRFLSSRFEKERVKPVLEALFEQPDQRVRWWALESMFTSLKFVPPERVESHLVNLLTEHESNEVKAAAAKALGAFGGADALKALVRFTGIFSDGAVKEAAKHAAARIRERLSR